MTLKVTYFTDNRFYKEIYTNVTHWYYEGGTLVIVTSNETLEIRVTVLFNCETWLSKN